MSLRSSPKTQHFPWCWSFSVPCICHDGPSWPSFISIKDLTFVLSKLKLSLLCYKTEPKHLGEQFYLEGNCNWFFLFLPTNQKTCELHISYIWFVKCLHFITRRQLSQFLKHEDLKTRTIFYIIYTQWFLGKIKYVTLFSPYCFWEIDLRNQK